MKRCITVLLLLALLGSQPSARAQTSNELYKLIPDNAQAAIMIPNLKRFSDQLTQMLEGMGRDNLLLGSRPIDQFKSITGFNLAIDDVGSVAIVFLKSQTPEPAMALLVPVTDFKAFIEGNLTRDSQGNYMLPSQGMVMHVKPFESHVALAEEPSAIEPLGPSEHSLLQAAQALGEPFKRLTTSGEAFIFLTSEGSQAVREFALEAQAQFGAPVDQLNALGEIQTGVLVLDFDPLALVLRSLVKFKPDSGFAALQDHHQEPAPMFAHLPAKPFYAAASADLLAIGGHEALAAIGKAAGLRELPAWISHAKSIEFAAYPSPLGVSGGLLNDGVLLVHTDDPAAVVDGIKQLLTAAPPADAAIKRQTKWEDSRTVETVGAASAYEVKILDVPQEFAMLRMAEQVVVGRSGWRGFVHQTPSAVIMTFSQRPAVLKAAIDALNQQGGGVATMATVRSLRQWLPQNSDVQMYFGVGQFGAIAKQMAQAFGQEQATAIPDFDPELPPIAVGIDLFPAGLESSTVIPSGVLAVLLDQAARAGRGPLDEPEEP